MPVAISLERTFVKLSFQPLITKHQSLSVNKTFASLPGLSEAPEYAIRSSLSLKISSGFPHPLESNSSSLSQPPILFWYLFPAQLALTPSSFSLLRMQPSGPHFGFLNLPGPFWSWGLADAILFGILCSFSFSFSPFLYHRLLEIIQITAPVLSSQKALL